MSDFFVRDSKFEYECEFDALLRVGPNISFDPRHRRSALLPSFLISASSVDLNSARLLIFLLCAIA